MTRWGRSGGPAFPVCVGTNVDTACGLFVGRDQRNSADHLRIRRTRCAVGIGGRAGSVASLIRPGYADVLVICDTPPSVVAGGAQPEQYRAMSAPWDDDGASHGSNAKPGTPGIRSAPSSDAPHMWRANSASGTTRNSRRWHCVISSRCSIFPGEVVPGWHDLGVEMGIVPDASRGSRSAHSTSRILSSRRSSRCRGSEMQCLHV